MAISAYMTINGTSGQIDGSVTEKGRENTVEVFQRANKVEIPIDPRTKENRGVRNHDTYNMTVMLDKATPYYFKALADGDTWPSLTLDTYRVVSGKCNKVYTEKLEHARVVSAEIIQPDTSDNSDKDKMRIPEQVNLNVAYQKITRTWEDGNITSTDDWKETSA
tara:strand:+ start:18141 stop:18632 length:492 start_codon:yes stop_codon:yes gene_type:complete